MSNYLSNAEPPSRSTGTITLSWGLMNIPLSLYTSTEESNLGRKEFVEGDTDRPAGRAVIDKSTGDIVDSSTVKRLSKADNGEWIEVTDDELASVVGVRNVAEILAFIPANDARCKYVPNAYMQLRPKKDKGVYNSASVQAYSLFLAAIGAKGVWALVSLATRGPARYGLITETGDLLYVHSTDEVRKPVPMILPPVEPSFLDMALQLIDAQGVQMSPELPNVTANGMRALVNAKAAGLAPTAASEPTATPAPDIMAALQASIQERKAKAVAWPAPTSPSVEFAVA